MTINFNLFLSNCHFSYIVLCFLLIFAAVGAGLNHHSELSMDIYTDPKTKIYVDNWGSARTELSKLEAPIESEVGDIINGVGAVPPTGITIFHSMGSYLRNFIN